MSFVWNIVRHVCSCLWLHDWFCLQAKTEIAIDSTHYHFCSSPLLYPLSVSSLHKHTCVCAYVRMCVCVRVHVCVCVSCLCVYMYSQPDTCVTLGVSCLVAAVLTGLGKGRSRVSNVGRCHSIRSKIYQQLRCSKKNLWVTTTHPYSDYVRMSCFYPNSHCCQVQKWTIAIKPPTDLPSTDQLTPAAGPQTPDSIFTIGAVSTLTPAVQSTPGTPTPNASSLTSEELTSKYSSLAEYTGNHQNSASETFITTAEILSHRITADGEWCHCTYVTVLISG